MPEQQQPNLLDLEKRDLTRDELWQIAQDANLAVESAELEYLTEEQWLRDQRRRIENLEANHTRIVGAMKVSQEPDAKPMFTNAESRKAEVTRRLNEDPQYRELIAALLTAENAQAERKIHIDALGRTYTLQRLRYEALTIGKRYQH